MAEALWVQIGMLFVGVLGVHVAMLQDSFGTLLKQVGMPQVLVEALWVQGEKANSFVGSPQVHCQRVHSFGVLSNRAAMGQDYFGVLSDRVATGQEFDVFLRAQGEMAQEFLGALRVQGGMV
ncbi:hypothetical protein KUCAC02_034400 [Chaenocephalus aceratus]|nr:hypothetical protein KUCAC02_034400 [Chaenocephalus aceratus]